MKTLMYKVACKSCLQTDGISHTIMIMNSYEELFEDRLLKSEYQLEQYVKDHFRETNNPCEFCKSYNLEISDIEFDREKALVGSNVDQFQLVITKDGDGEIDVKTGGSQYLPSGFLNEAFDIIETAIANTPKNEFEEKYIGNIRFVVSTGFIDNDSFRTNRLEQFKFVGFSKEKTANIVSIMKSRIIR